MEHMTMRLNITLAEAAIIEELLLDASIAASAAIANADSPADRSDARLRDADIRQLYVKLVKAADASKAVRS